MMGEKILEPCLLTELGDASVLSLGDSRIRWGVDEPKVDAQVQEGFFSRPLTQTMLLVHIDCQYYLLHYF